MKTTKGKLNHGATYEDNGESVTIKGHCIFSGGFFKCTVPSKEFNIWLAGKHIQEAMPNVSANDREFLISGISPQGWSNLFPEEEDYPQNEKEDYNINLSFMG